MKRAMERLREMISAVESVAYGMQTKADLPAFRATANSKVSLTSISRSDAGVVADLISGKWSKDSPAIEFVNTINDLPQDVKESAGKETAEQDKTKGIHLIEPREPLQKST